MPASFRRSLTSPYVLLALIGAAIYSLILFNGFVDDDISQVVLNNQVHNWSGIAQSFKGASGFYRPLMFSYLSTVCSIFGLHAIWFHLFQLVLAVANILMVYWLLRLFSPKRVAFGLSLIFLLQPLNIDAVAFISHIGDILFVFFGLLSLVLVRSKLASRYKIPLLTLTLLVSLLSKESGVFFLMISLVFAWFYVRKSFKQAALAVVSAAIAYGLIRLSFATAQTPSVSAPVASLGIGGHLLQVPENIWRYISNFIYPHNLAISQLAIVKRVDLYHFWLPLFIELLAMAALIILGWRIKQASRLAWRNYLFFTSWLALALGGQSQLLPINDATWANWWFYLPMVGLLGMVAVALPYMEIKRMGTKRLALGFIVLWMIFLGWQTVLRERNFRSELVLLKHDESVNTGSYLLESEYGQQLAENNQFSVALSHLYRATSLYPATNAWSDIGVIYEKQGQTQVAEKYFRKSIQMAPESAIGYYDLAELLLEQQGAKPAISFLNESLKRFPNDALLWALTAEAYQNDGNTDASARAYSQAELLAKQQGLKLSVTKNNEGGTFIRFGGQ